MDNIKNKKSFLLVILSVVLAIITGFLIYSFINKHTEEAPIYMAKKEITKGDPLNPDMFEISYIAKSAIPKGTLKPSKENDEYIKQLIASKDISNGDILKSNYVYDVKTDDLAILSARLRTIIENAKVKEDVDLVGGEIPVDSIKGMLDGMKAGDMVYIVNVTREKDDESNGDVITQAEEVVDEAIVVGVKGGDEGNALIVALDKKDALKLAEAREKGKVYAYLLPFGKNIDIVQANKLGQEKNIDEIEEGE